MTEATRITVRLTPRGGHDAIDGWSGDVLRVRVAAPPVDGAANDALLRLLAKALAIPRSRLAIASGSSGRTKMLSVEGMSIDEARRRLH